MEAVKEASIESIHDRTMRFSVCIVRLYSRLPKSTEAQVIGKQLLRSGTSVGAQYREASRGRTTAEFVSKLNSGLQELEETRYWLQLMVASEVVPQQTVKYLLDEARQLVASLCLFSTKSKQTLKLLNFFRVSDFLPFDF